MFGYRKLVLSVTAIILILTLSVAAKSEVVTKTFDAKKSVNINTVSGDVVIMQGNNNEISVTVESNIRPRDSFEPVFKERRSGLYLNEEFYENNSSGRVTWTITVPEGTEIDFNTASGDFTCENFKGEINVSTASGNFEIFKFDGELDISTASGNIDLDDCHGYLKFSSASGDLKIENCSGAISASTASGDVDVSGVILDDESSFSSASGDVYVELDKSPEYDLKLASASGNSVLNFNGNPVNGYFEFVAKYHKGDIEAPYDFEEEEQFRHPGDRDKYVRKAFTKGNKAPYILIKTATGRAVLEER